jgi:hypothetical protein
MALCFENQQHTGKWGEDEDLKLKDAVQMHGGKDWAAIAAALASDRTRSQCSKPGSPARHPRAPNGSPHAPPPHYHGDPYSSMPYPPPPHGMFSQYPGPSHVGVGGYHYQKSHYHQPPPRHMPMYVAQHPPGAP